MNASSAVSARTSTAATQQHRPWCGNHVTDNRPEDGWCESSPVEVAGLVTTLVDDYADTGEPRINVDEWALTPSQARQLAAELVRLADEVTPAAPEALGRLFDMSRVAGFTLDKLADDARVDLDGPSSVTYADVRRMTDAFVARTTAYREADERHDRRDG